MKDPIAQAQAQEGGGTGVNGLARTQSFARGHKRAMTLPQLGMNGLPVPPNLSETEVVGEFFEVFSLDTKRELMLLNRSSGKSEAFSPR